MKKLFILIGLVMGNLVFAQTPQFIHYQAVIRDGNGAVLSNQTVSLKIEITQGQNTYTEIRTVNTNNVGLVNLSIGNLPAPNSIPFSSINWAGGNTSMITWYDPTGSGSNWQYIASSNIASVPYALHAANVFSGDFNDLTNVPSIDSSNTNEIQTISAQGDTIYLSNGGQIYYGRFSGNFADLNGVPTIDTSYTNELQTIAKSGDTISLSNGGGIVVVNTFSGDFNDLSNVPNIDTSNTNELQVLSMSGDTLHLSNGGYVALPADKWQESNGYIYRVGGTSRVHIGSSNPPDAKLEVSSGIIQSGISITRPSLLNGSSVNLNFNLLDTNGQKYKYGQIGGGIIRSSGPTGFLSFAVADGSTWNTPYNSPVDQEKMRLTPSGLGIEVSDPKRSLHVNGSIRLNPLVSAPSVGAKGDIYVDTNGCINFFNGTKWINTQQDISLIGDTLKLSDGGFVLMPLSSKAEEINDLTDGKTTATSIALGTNALQNNAVGINNTALGQNALMLDTIGTGNTAVGFEALKNSAHSDENTAIGQQSLKSNTHGSYNVAVGYKASENNFTGEHNTAVGHSALKTNAYGVENTAIGKNSQKVSIVNGNTSVGASSLESNTTGDYNVAVGRYALSSNMTGSQNTAIGANSMKSAQNMIDNTAVGFASLEYSEGNGNTAIGHHSLNKNSSGTNNTAIGKNSMFRNTTGSSNVSLGYFSLEGNQFGSGNTALGFYSLANLGLDSSISNNNTSIGNAALSNLKNGFNNIAIGNSTAGLITEGANNIFIGGTSIGGLRTLPVYSNVAIGGGTGSSLDSNAYANVLIGENAGNMLRGGSDNTAVGHAALQMSPKGGYNVAIGTQSMQMSNVETSSNTAVGAQTLVNVASSDNTAIGKGSQNQTTTGGSNTSLGVSSLNNNTTGSNNVAIGVNSLYSNTTGFGNTSLGTYSLTSNQTGQENVAIGFSAMAGNLSGSLNTAVGLYTLYGYQGLTGSYNTALGAHVLANTTTGEGNTGLGYWVFPNLKAGSYNIGVGNNVGSNVRGASENVLIGHESDVQDSSISNSISVGYQAVVRTSNTVQLGNINNVRVATYGRYEGKGATFNDSSSTGDNAILRLSSNSKGFIFPTMTYAERQNVTPEVGMAIYCKDCGNSGQLQIYNGNLWTDFNGGASFPPSLYGGLIGSWDFNGNTTTTFNDTLFNSGGIYTSEGISFSQGTTCGKVLTTTIKNAGINTSHQFTFAIKIKRNSVGCGQDRLFLMSNPTGPLQAFQCWWTANGAPVFFHQDPTQSVGMTFDPISFGQWVTLVYVNDGQNAKFYQDGILKATFTNTMQNLSFPKKAWMGNGNVTNVQGWNGSIKEMKLWDRPLTFAEIQLL